MANNSPSVLLALLLVSICILCMAGRAFAGRDIPVQQELFSGHHKLFSGHHEGTVLIPGIGRVMIPPKHHGKKKFINPFTYNPITGTYGGGGGIGSIGSGSGTGRSYVPGGDDTFVPNPGFEVPNPGSAGGKVPASARP